MFILEMELEFYQMEIYFLQSLKKRSIFTILLAILKRKDVKMLYILMVLFLEHIYHLPNGNN